MFPCPDENHRPSGSITCVKCDWGAGACRMPGNGATPAGTSVKPDGSVLMSGADGSR